MSDPIIEALEQIERNGLTLHNVRALKVACDEIGRLQAAKRDALKIANERSKENVALRNQLVSANKALARQLSRRASECAALKAIYDISEETPANEGQLDSIQDIAERALMNVCAECKHWRHKAERLREELKEAVADHDYDARRWAEEIKAAQDQLVKAEEERDSLQQVFDLQWEADQRAIKRWQEAHPGNDLVWPDRADMVVWLMEKYALGEQK